MTHRGRELFGANVSYGTLAGMLSRGAELKQTRLTDTFGYDDLQNQHPKLLPLLAWNSTRQIVLHVEGEAFNAKPQWTVMYLLGNVSGGKSSESKLDAEHSLRH
jgi:hypothetical protein